MGERTLKIGQVSITAEDSTDLLHVTDAAAATQFREDPVMNYGTVSLQVDGGRMLIDGITFRMPQGMLRLCGTGLTSELVTVAAALSISNVTSDPAEADIIVHQEPDSLNLVEDGLYTSTGIIDVRLLGEDARLALLSGVLRTTAPVSPLRYTPTTWIWRARTRCTAPAC